MRSDAYKLTFGQHGHGIAIADIHHRAGEVSGESLAGNQNDDKEQRWGAIWQKWRMRCQGQREWPDSTGVGREARDFERCVYRGTSDEVGLVLDEVTEPFLLCRSDTQDF